MQASQSIGLSTGLGRKGWEDFLVEGTQTGLESNSTGAPRPRVRVRQRTGPWQLGQALRLGPPLGQGRPEAPASQGSLLGWGAGVWVEVCSLGPVHRAGRGCQCEPRPSPPSAWGSLTPVLECSPTPHLAPLFSFRTFQNSSRSSSNGPALGARRGLHPGAQPGGLPGLLLHSRGGPPLVRQPAEALVASAPLDAGPRLGHPVLGHGVGGRGPRPEPLARHALPGQGSRHRFLAWSAKRRWRRLRDLLLAQRNFLLLGGAGRMAQRRTGTLAVFATPGVRGWGRRLAQTWAASKTNSGSNSNGSSRSCHLLSTRSVPGCVWVNWQDHPFDKGSGKDTELASRGPAGNPATAGAGQVRAPPGGSRGNCNQRMKPASCPPSGMFPAS